MKVLAHVVFQKLGRVRVCFRPSWKRLHAILIMLPASFIHQLHKPTWIRSINIIPLCDERDARPKCSAIFIIKYFFFAHQIMKKWSGSQTQEEVIWYKFLPCEQKFTLKNFHSPLGSASNPLFPLLLGSCDFP